MPNPVQSDLHVNVPLTNVSVAFIQKASAYVAHKVFPRVPVQKQSDMFWKYNKSDWRRTDVQKRAPGTESAGVGWKVDTDNYFAHVYAVHKDIDDQLRANADSFWKLDKDATAFVTNQLLLKRDLDWVNSFFKSGVWGTDLVGGTDFTVYSDDTSDPVSDFAQYQIDFVRETGYKANKLVIGADVLAKLKQHPDIIDRIKYTQKGIVSTDLLATLFDVEEVVVNYASYTGVQEQADGRTQDAAATYSFIANPKDMLLCYSPSAPSMMTPAAGYTFTWNGYLGGNDQGVRIKNFRMEHLEVDRIEGSMTYAMKVIAPEMGMFFSGAVA